MNECGFPDAALEDVPALLARPPWVDRPQPVVLALTPPPLCEVSWEEGEREAWLVVPEWAASQMASLQSDHPDWMELIGRGGDGSSSGEIGVSFTIQAAPSARCQMFFLAFAPLELVEPLLAGGSRRDFEPRLTNENPYSKCWPRVIARQESPELAASLALWVERAGINQPFSLIVPFATAEIATAAAGWLDYKGSRRNDAVAWLRRHPRSAAALLIPAALGKPGKARLYAEHALVFLSKEGFRDDVLAAADEYGIQARSGVDVLLAADPLSAVLPAIMPTLPDWLQFSVLPQVLLRTPGPDGQVQALPESAVRALVTLAQISVVDEPYPGAESIREIVGTVVDQLDQTSLAGFAWAVFQAWANQGYPGRSAWVMDFQGLVGDDQTVRLLTPLIRVWPGESAHQRAVKGLDVLLAIGSDVALLSLNGLAVRSKFKGIKDQANARIQQLAQQRGLTPEQLADRLVPDFGLDADGRTRLDFGDKQFIVGFDELLRTVVFDADGKPRKSLPKPSGEPGIAEAARFAALKKDVRQVAGDQVLRLEQAMVSQRTWSVEEFVELLVKQPLVWNLTRRLVWAGSNGTFRVAEDRTFADVTDTEVELVGPIRVVHPLVVGAEMVRAWSVVFADYEIVQPFPQLARDVHTVDEVAGLCGATAPTLALVGLEKRGWRRSSPQDTAWQPGLERPLPDGRTLVLDCDPGFAIGVPAAISDKQKLGAIDVTGLDPVTIREIVRDLVGVIG